MKAKILFLILVISFFFSGNSVYAAPYVINHGIIAGEAALGQKILKEAYRRIGEEITFNLLPAARALELSNRGVTDGELSRVDNMQEKYPNLVKVPTSYMQVDNVAFTKKLDIHVAGYKSLRPYRIAFRLGLKAAEFGTDGFSQVYMVKSDKQAFSMLDMGRVDVVIDGRLVGSSEVEKLGLQGVRILDDPVDRVPLYHYLHKKNQGLVSRLDAAIQSMLKDGTIDTIIGK